MELPAMPEVDVKYLEYQKVGVSYTRRRERTDQFRQIQSLITCLF